MHTFEGYSMKSFGKCKHLCNQHLSQDITLLSFRNSLMLLYNHSLPPLVRFLLFRNFIWIELCDSFVTGFFDPACFWDLSMLLLVLLVSLYFSVIFHCVSIPMFLFALSADGHMSWFQFWFLVEKPLWPFGPAFCGCIFYFLLGKYLAVVGSLGHVVTIDLTWWETARPLLAVIGLFSVGLGFAL